MKPEQKHLVNVFEMHQTCVLHDKQRRESQPSMGLLAWGFVYIQFSFSCVGPWNNAHFRALYMWCRLLMAHFPRREWAPSPQPESWIKGGLFIHLNMTENNIREICGSVYLQRSFEKVSGWENNTLEIINYNYWTVETIETKFKKIIGRSIGGRNCLQSDWRNICCQAPAPH